MHKILITGGNGFIAFNFIKMMLKSDYDIVSIDNLSLSKHLNHETINFKSDKFKFIECDIVSNDVCELIKKYKFDAIVNFAAESHVDKSIHSSNLFVDKHKRITNLLACCNDLIKNSVLSNDFRFIHVSTDGIWLLAKKNLHLRSSILNLPIHIAYQKYRDDHMDILKLIISVIITRCSNNYGIYLYPEN